MFSICACYQKVNWNQTVICMYLVNHSGCLWLDVHVLCYTFFDVIEASSSIYISVNHTSCFVFQYQWRKFRSLDTISGHCTGRGFSYMRSMSSIFYIAKLWLGSIIVLYYVNIGNFIVSYLRWWRLETVKIAVLYYYCVWSLETKAWKSVATESWNHDC